MASTTSGSMQSSSGGAAAANEDYTTNSEPISSFLDTTATASPFPFDSFSNYLNPFPPPTNRIPTPPPSSIDLPPPQAPAPPSNKPAARASKKRSRASRRPPTTVLATDTSNFRAMVQEFTGFPVPQFASASYARPRLAAPPPPPQPQPQPYLSRPFPHKIQVAPSFSPSFSLSSNNNISTIEAIASIARSSMNMNNAATNVNSFFTSSATTPPPSTSHQQLNLLDFHIPSSSFANSQSQPNNISIPFLGNLSGEGLGLGLESTSNPTRFKPDIRDYISLQRSGDVDINARFSSSETDSHVFDIGPRRR